jgi:hypothetical protein
MEPTALRKQIDRPSASGGASSHDAAGGMSKPERQAELRGSYAAFKNTPPDPNRLTPSTSKSGEYAPKRPELPALSDQNWKGPPSATQPPIAPSQAQRISDMNINYPPMQPLTSAMLHNPVPSQNPVPSSGPIIPMSHTYPPTQPADANSAPQGSILSRMTNAAVGNTAGGYTGGAMLMGTVILGTAIVPMVLGVMHMLGKK